MRHKARIVLAFELTRAAAPAARVRIVATGELKYTMVEYIYKCL